MEVNIKTKFNIGDRVQSKYQNCIKGVIRELKISISEGYLFISYCLTKDNGLSLVLDEDSIELVNNNK